jgi:hypothetical protein
MLEQVAAATVQKWNQEHPQQRQPLPKAEVPAPLKWAAIVISAVMSAVVVGVCFWVITTLSNLQITVARMDERQQRDMTPSRLDKIEERLMRLEQAGKGVRQ